MVEQDTIKLLRECDAGVKMGISSIDDVLKYVSSDELKKILKKSKQDHEELETEIENLNNEIIILSSRSIENKSILAFPSYLSFIIVGIIGI